MFNNSFKLIPAIGVLVLAGFTAVSAQIGFGSELKIGIPHSFIINDKEFPAGKYIVSPVFTDGSSSMLKVQSENGKESALFETLEKFLDQPSKETELIFNHVGDEYFLSEIRIEGDDQSNQILETKAEKQALSAAAVN